MTEIADHTSRNILMHSSEGGTAVIPIPSSDSIPLLATCNKAVSEELFRELAKVILDEGKVLSQTGPTGYISDGTPDQVKLPTYWQDDCGRSVLTLPVVTKDLKSGDERRETLNVFQRYSDADTPLVASGATDFDWLVSGALTEGDLKLLERILAGEEADEPCDKKRLPHFQKYGNVSVRLDVSG